MLFAAAYGLRLGVCTRADWSVVLKDGRTWQRGRPSVIQVEPFDPSTTNESVQLNSKMIASAPTVTVSNPWRDRILQGEVCSVMSCKYFISNEVAMMTRMAGIDGMFIDMEHSVLTMREVSQLVTACNYVGVSPIVRIPSKAHWHLSRVLDAGAAAVVIPHCESVEQVKGIVRDAKYAPLGIRGCANNQPILNFQPVPTNLQNEVLNRETMGKSRQRHLYTSGTC